MQRLNLKAIGERIAAQRRKMGYTHEKLAEITGLSTRFCSEIEGGKKGMSCQTLYTYTKALNLSADFILTGYDKENDEEIGIIVGMLKTCNPDKIIYIEKNIGNFLLALK